MKVFRLVLATIAVKTAVFLQEVSASSASDTISKITADTKSIITHEENEFKAENFRDPVAVVGVSLGLAVIVVGGIISVQLRYAPCRRLSKNGTQKRFQKVNDFYEKNATSFYSNYEHYDSENDQGKEEMQKLFMHEHPEKLDNPYIYAYDNARLL